MNCLQWNCQGLWNPRIVNVLCDFVQRWDPKIIFLSERELNRVGMEIIKRKVDILYGLIVPSDGQSGGLAMLWKKDINLDIVGYFDNYIDTIVTESPSGFKWRITGFYGHPKTHLRNDSWELLATLTS